MSDLEGAIRGLVLSANLGEPVAALEAIDLLEDVLGTIEEIKTCASACVQWPGDSDKDQAIRAAGVILCDEYGVELRESSLGPS